MKATLYKLKEGYVLCSDEQPNHDYKGLMLFTPAMRLLNDMGVSLMGDFKKVLTQSPDFSELSEEDAKRIGWFDVEKLAEQNGYPETSQFYDYKEGFIDGFEEAQELLSDRMFTEEDIKGFVDYLYTNNILHDYKDGKSDFRIVSIAMKNYIQSLSQPKSWEVEYKEENGVYKVTKIL